MSVQTTCSSSSVKLTQSGGLHFGLRGWTGRHKRDDGETLMAALNSPLFLIVQRINTRGVKPRLATLKMFATGEKRCPVAFLKNYLNKCPAELKKTGSVHVYLSIIDKSQTSSVWYKKNTINNFMKTIKKLTSARCLPRQKANQPQCNKNGCNYKDVEELRNSIM